MNRLGKILALLILFCSFSQAQTPVLQSSFDISIARGLNTTGFNIANRGLSAHIFTWSLQAGVMTSCTLSFQTSSNNITWTTQTTGDCTSSGTTAYLTFVANYVRISATTFTTQSGTALVTVNYAGYVIPPTSIATITTAPLTNQNIETIRYAKEFSGADAGVKILAAMNDSVAGGYVFANFETAQNIATAITFPKAIHLVCGQGVLTFTGTAGPLFTMTANSVIENCSLRNSANGVSADAITPAQNAKILNNHIEGNVTTSAGATAIDGCNCTGVEIAGNEILNYGGHAINTGGNDNNGYWNIHDNYIHDSHDDGILLGGVGSHIVFNNKIITNGSNGIDSNSPNNIIKSNQVVGNGASYSGTGIDCYGILVTPIGLGSADDNIIEGNRVLNNKCQGIVVRGDGATNHANHVIVRNNIVSSNVAAGAAGIGINIDTSVGATCGTVNYTSISGNTVYGMSAQGILQGGGAGAPCVTEYTSIKDNIVTGNTGIGIYAVWGTSGTISNNTSLSNTGGNLTISGPTKFLDSCNLTDSTLNQCVTKTGNLGTDTLIPGAAGANEVKVQGPGNTQLTLHSTGGGSYRDYSLLLDSGGNFYLYDATGAVVRLSLSSAGAMDVKTSLNIGSGGAVSKWIPVSATLDFPNTLAQNSSALTISATGALIGYPCIVGITNIGANANTTYTCEVVSNDLLTVKFNNYSAGAINPASAGFTALYFKF